MTYVKTSQAGSQVTATTTATSLKALMLTADATLTEAMFSAVDVIELNAEGAIRWLPYSSPTTAKGMKLGTDETRIIHGINPADVYLIAGSNTLVNVSIGKISPQ